MCYYDSTSQKQTVAASRALVLTSQVQVAQLANVSGLVAIVRRMVVHND